MGEVVVAKMKTGNKKVFKSEEDFKKNWDKYVDTIVLNGYTEVITYTGFARMMNCAYKTVQRFLKEYPGVKEYCQEIMADILVTGAIKGTYKSTPAIFALKNRCNWVDKVESRNVNSDKNVATKEEADEALEKFLQRKKA